LSGRWRIKIFYRSDHSSIKNDTSEMTHVGREKERTHKQNNIKAKAKQLKLSKIYPSTWS
jgi:hypothetical protein